MLLFFLLLKIFFAEQLPFTSLHWKLIFGYFLLLSVAVLVYPVFRKMRDQDRWSIQNGAIEIEEGVLRLPFPKEADENASVSYRHNRIYSWLDLLNAG